MAWVVFFRGVNVGGHKAFRPSVIAKDLAEFDVVNVGAAGTFVVRKSISLAAPPPDLAPEADERAMDCVARARSGTECSGDLMEGGVGPERSTPPSASVSVSDLS
jgi:hypothetical protein